jgi:hypothetical protein
MLRADGKWEISVQTKIVGFECQDGELLYMVGTRTKSKAG